MLNNKSMTAQHHQTFESIRHLNDDDSEFWYARDLAPLLDYQDWRNFVQVVEKAKTACERSSHAISDHFGDVTKMVDLGSGAKRGIVDYKLSRYACYLLVQNGDPTKPVIANGQTYFALQTRRQELRDNKVFAGMSEDQRRLMLRNELAHHNKALSAAARESGVETTLDYAVFQNHGYQGLYGGLDAKDIHARKQLKKSQKILDYMGSTELAANLFRATQTEEKLRRDEVAGKRQANQTHFSVGSKVRQTIRELGGTMPESLPTPEASVHQLGRDKDKLKR